MTKLRPFKALRPVRDKAHLVAALPHYLYKKNVLKAMLEVNPYLFLNIINPEFKNRTHSGANSQERFEQIRENYGKFIQEGVLKSDKVPSIYLYRQTKGDREFLGVIGGASVEEYKDGLIKNHEATITSREAMFTNYLDIVGYNAEPVLLSYTGTEEIDQILSKKTKERAEYEFTTTDLNKHELWILNNAETISITSAFEKLKAVYIADGHHRSASSAGLRELRNKRGEKHFPNEDYFMALFIDERKLQILEYNRLLKTLNDHSPDDIIQLLSNSFEIKKIARAQKPKKEHEMTMCIGKDWYILTCKSKIIDEKHPVNCLDSRILTHQVLNPIFGIKDLKTDENIDFVSGDVKLTEINKVIKKGEYKIGFVLFPVSIDKIKRVADNDMIMPPKSTWIEPKLRSGLTIYNLNE